MRTVEISDTAYEQAERAAEARGITVSEYMDQMLLSKPEGPSATSGGKRVQFPIIPSTGKGTLHITAEDIRKLDEEEDLRQISLLQ